MYQKRFIRFNCIVTLFAFVFSIFSVNFSFVGSVSAQENAINQITEGLWTVKNAKGEFTAAGSGGYETWADGKQRFVLRDALGHLMSWGEAKIDKMTGGQLKITVTGNEGNIEAVKVSAPALETAKAVKAAVFDSAPAAVVSPAPAVPASVNAAPSSVDTAPKMSIGEKLSALKTKITTPIETGGKGSAAWEKGYNFGKDTPTNLVNKVKGVFSKGDSAPAGASAPAATAAGPNAPAPAPSAAAAVGAKPAPAPSAPAISASAPADASAAVASAPKMSIGEKLSALKTKITTPIETGGKGSAAWEKGYNFGKDTPTNLVNKVKGVFSKGDSAPAGASAPAATAAGPNAPAPVPSAAAAVGAKPAPAPSAPAISASAPADASAAAPAAPNATLGQKLSALKDKVTTPIEGGGKGSAAWEKGYNFGKDAPTNAVNKVKGLFSKNAAPAETGASVAVGSSNASAPLTAAGPNAPAPAPSAAAAVGAKPAPAPSAPAISASAPADASAAAPAAPKATLGQKLSALKDKVTTPIEGGGKGSAAWEKGYRFGKETPENAVNKVKGLFKRSTQEPAAAENASKEAAAQGQTPSQKLADHKNARVEFDEKTGQFEKVPLNAPPSKLSTAFSAGKDSLKASFSVKNLGISAGLTVGFKIFEQVKNGEKISIGKAVGHLATGEFAGSFVGSGLGSAAGTVVGSLLGSTVPVVGPVLGALMPAIFGQVGGHIGSSLGNDLASGQKPSFKKAIASIDKVAVVGQAVGSTIGAAIGSMILPGFGSMIGGLVGGMIGNVIVNQIRNRAKSNYHIAGVNAYGGQIIYGEQVAPPPSQTVINASGISASGSGEAQGIYDRMINAYKRYSQLLSEGQGESPACQQALSEYKQLYTSYANSLQGQQK